MSVILIGYRGSGKTTIGRRLADRLWQRFVDVDEMIVQQAGKSIREIFEQEGESGFRDRETAAIEQAAKLSEHVIALGGGAPMREINRKLLKDAGHKVVYLRCEPEVLLKRIAGDAATAANRPNLTSLGGGIEEIRQLLAQREPVYRQMMDAELDVTHLTPDEALVFIGRMI